MKFSKMSKKQKITLLTILIIVFLSVILLFLFFIGEGKVEWSNFSSSVFENKGEKVKYYSKLSGVEVANKELETAPVFGVMIENSPNARPQSGLNDAELVFEAIAEGGITRFLALYQQNKPANIGPVRSIRGYYIDWAGGFNASITHVGGSGDALTRMRDGNHRDIDEILTSGVLWRAQNRYAPHNVYTSISNLEKYASSKGWTSSNFIGFERKNDSPAKEKTASQIQVNISGATYNSSYNYDQSCNCYLRNQAGAPHLDSSGTQISTKSIVVLKMNHSLAADRYYSNYANIGSGSGIVFQDGTFTEIAWQKDSENSPLTLKTTDRKNVKLNRGKTWLVIEGIPNGSTSWQ